MSKGLETKEKILERAYLLASKDGLEGLTIGSLADALSMSKSGLFAHFGSKEELQVAVLQHAAQLFEQQVVVPAFKAPRGEPRVKKLLDNWLEWASGSSAPGGCIFVAAAAELDDQEGRARDYLVGSQRALISTLAKAARLAIEAGHFRPDLDCEQFGFDAYAVILGYHHSRRLLRDPKADARARQSFERLLKAARLTH